VRDPWHGSNWSMRASVIVVIASRLPRRLISSRHNDADSFACVVSSPVIFWIPG
jgi:hypothetical protein